MYIPITFPLLDEDKHEHYYLFELVCAQMSKDFDLFYFNDFI